jgi:hypothetical protein
MNTYEREYFVSRIRSGFLNLKLNDLTVRVLTPTLEDEYLSNEVFMESFDEARRDNILTQDEMLDWMKDRDLWSEEKDQKIKDCEDNIEKLKVEIFNLRTNEKLRETARLYLRATEKALGKLRAEKDDLFTKTCEGIGTQDKMMFLFERCCYFGSEPLDFKNIDISNLYYQYNQAQLNETQLRELARNDPWRLAWYSKDHAPLFTNLDNRTLSNEQKGIIIWANMYDNIQESMDCPTEDVINDDDMLDGWFIVQKRKQKSEKAKSELEARTSNEKIANSDEIMIMASSKQEAENIHHMNSIGSDVIRRKRLATAKKLGTATDFDFEDRKLEIQNQQRQMFKDSTRR